MRFFNFKEMCKEIPNLESFADKKVDDLTSKETIILLEDWAKKNNLEFVQIVYCENGLYVFREQEQE